MQHLQKNIIRDQSQKVPGLKLLYHNIEVESLCITDIVIWNSGFGTIESKDIVLKDRLRIASKQQIELYDINLIEVNNQANDVNLTVSSDKKAVLMNLSIWIKIMRL